MTAFNIICYLQHIHSMHRVYYYYFSFAFLFHVISHILDRSDFPVIFSMQFDLSSLLILLSSKTYPSVSSAFLHSLQNRSSWSIKYFPAFVCVPSLNTAFISISCFSCLLSSSEFPFVAIQSLCILWHTMSLKFLFVF